MKIEQLRQVVETYQAGSINKAAQNLYIAQSTLSNSIQAVETELGLSIFIRNKRGIELTDFGKKFIEHSMKILSHYQDILDETKRANQMKANRKIGISVYYLQYANRIFYQIFNQHPDSNIEFFYQNDPRDRIIEDVANSISEIGLLSLPSLMKPQWLDLMYSRGLEFSLIKKEKPYILFGPTSPLYNQKLSEITTEALRRKQLNMITLKENTDFFRSLEEQVVKFFDPYKQVTLNDYGLLVDILLRTNGFFVATINENAYKEEAFHPQIQYLPVTDVPYHYEIGWIKKQNTSISKLSTQFIDTIVATICGTDNA